MQFFCVLSCWQLGKVVNDLSIKKSGYPSKSTVELIFLFDWASPNPIKRKNPFGHLCPYSLPGRGAGRGRHACVSAEGRNGTRKNKNRKRYRPNLNKELLQRITSHRNQNLILCIKFNFRNTIFKTGNYTLSYFTN